MGRIVFKPHHNYTLRGVLPRTNRTINLCNIFKKEDYELLAPTYLKFFKKIYLFEQCLYGHRSNIVTTRINNDVDSISRVIIPRIKRKKRGKIQGNVFLRKDEKYFYIQAKAFKKRVVLKFDLEDEVKIMSVLKKTYYFRAKYFKSYKRVYFIHNKYKLRTNSVYRYILGERIYNQIEHIDGNMYNYSKANLRILDYKSPVNKEKTRPSFKGIMENKPLDELIGIKRYSDRGNSKYVVNIMINKVFIKIGRFNDPYEAAMAYDISMMYYRGPTHTKNYPYEFYVNLKQDLVSKWFSNLENRKFKRNIELAQSLL